ncbi:MAG: aminoacyl-histidine dipeptidase [Thermoplasmatales archaeon SG8-52-3]|jgi:dipeptidase D|nr:MAG: aminoacyl-histidine dipeptidase [Thermoplasmatales archaeon SG8-52-3]
MSVLDNLEPKLVWKHFDEIRKIPRCSKHEEIIRKYVIDFAKKQNLKSKTDNIGNIVIFKNASSGMENKPTVVLQGHMDMVCEKNSDVIFDFSKDSIKLKLDGDYLTADGTTLGADNGIGLAMSLAILEDKSLKLGPIEALFTVDEETGLTGAFAMESDMITGKILLNLDSEDFGVVTVGCAGGGDSKIEVPIKNQSINSDLNSIIIKISGLRGGHSGVDIHEQRGNAVKLLSRMLWKASNDYDFYVTEMKGGDKHNAIPREAYAKVSIKKADKNKFIDILKNEENDILKEIKPIDPNFNMDIEDISKLSSTLTKDSQNKILNLLHGLPHGIDKMSYDIPNLVETSTNLASVTFNEKNALIHLSTRSSINSSLQDLRDRIHAIAELSNAKVTEEKPYPGWKPNLDSKILKLSKKIFKEMYGKEPKVEAIHAGLECGIIGEKFPGMDMISIGPTLKYPHSPEEQLHVSTVGKTYKYVIEILKNV